jgi:ABC-type amino acid transport substrate-binding protein
MKRFKSLLLGALLLGVFSVVAVGCGSSNDSSSSSSGVPDTITAGSDIPYKPMEFGQAPYEGFDIDIVNEIAKRIDTKVTFKKTPFDTIFRDLAQGKFDTVASSATITKERLQQVDFSDPYFPADQSMLVTKGSDIKVPSDMDGKVVGVQAGTTGEIWVKANVKAKSVRPYDLVDDAFNALAAGQVDAVVADFPVAKEAADAKSTLLIVTQIPTGEQYGIAFEKGSTLQGPFNDAISKMKDDGTYTTIYKKWFDAEPPQAFMDQDKTAEEVAVSGG